MNKRNKSIFSLIFTLFIVLNVLTILIGSIAYIFYLNNIRKLTNERQYELIIRAMDNLEDGLSDLDRVSTQIVSLAKKMDFMYMDDIENNPEAIYEIYEFISLNSLYADMSGFVDTSYVYFAKPDILIANTAMYPSSLRDSYPEVCQRVFSARNDRNRYCEYDDRTGTLYYVRRLETARQEMGFIILSINQSKLLGYLETIVDIDQSAFMLEFMPSNQIVSVIDSNGILSSDIRTQIQETDSESSSIKTEHGRYLLMTRDTMNRDWRLAILINENLLRQGLIPIFIIAACTIMLQLLFGLIISYVFSRYSYTPIRKLRDFISAYPPTSREQTADDEVENELDFIGQRAGALFEDYREMLEENEKNSSMLEDGYIVHILHGCRGLDLPDVGEGRSLFRYPMISVIAIRVEKESPSIGRKTMEALHVAVQLVKDAVADMAEKSFPGSKVVEYNMDTIALIINANDLDGDRVYAFAENIQTFLFNRLDTLTTIGISASGNDPDNLYALGKEAFEAVNQESITGMYSIRVYHTPENPDRPAYSIADETLLLNAIKTADRNMVVKLLKDSFGRNIASLRNNNTAYIRMFISSHINTLIRSCNTLKIPEDVISDKDIQSILEAAKIDSAFNQLKDLYDRITEYLYTNKKSHNDVLFGKIMEYIKAHCFDSSLCLVSIADNFSLNPTYLSVFLKEQLGETYITYITDLRLEKARKILEETDMSIADIATSVGYLSSGVFIRVFKKKFGTSPGNYRQNIR